MKTIQIHNASLFIIFFLMGRVASPQDNRVAEIDKMMKYASDNSLYNGVITVAEKGKIIYNKGFGYTDVESRKMINETTLFNLCSITKQFTAMCVMILKEQGKLSYEDKLTKYFPALSYNNNITLRHLLNHTSGLPDYFALLFQNWQQSGIPTNTDAIRILEQSGLPLRFTPGEKFEYSNTGYILLASIIEKVSNMSYPDFLKENIFKKAGMTNTLVYMPGISQAITPNYAKPYTYDYLKCKPVLTADFEQYRRQVTGFDGTYGDGGIHSCSKDMIAWDNALKTELLVKKATLEEAFINTILNNGSPIAPVGYGFGWFIVNDPVNGKLIQHTGGWPGFRQAIIRYLDKDRTLLVLRNNEVAFSGIQKAIENILDGKPYTMPQTGLAYMLSVVALRGSDEDVRKKFEDLKNNSIVREDEINLAGYGVMGQNKIKQALEIMKINAELFPGSWNAFDSLGELYLKNGDKENAKRNYQKSLELNPANDEAKKALANL